MELDRLADASALGAEGRGSNPLRPDHEQLERIEADEAISPRDHFHFLWMPRIKRLGIKLKPT
jgi:hypothetical protein